MGRSFGFSESRIFAQHQNWEAVEEGVLCEQERYGGQCEAVSRASVLKMMNDLSIFNLRILITILLGGTF